MTGIPSDVIEAMVRTFHVDVNSRGGTVKTGLRAALRAAEAKDYKLIGREPTEAMLDACANSLGEWQAMWDAAPGVGKP